MTHPKRTQYLDLDAVVPDKEIVIKLRGKEHKLAPTTLADFVRNTQATQGLGVQTDPIKEMKLISDMLLRAFPTMVQDDIDGLTLDQLGKLYEFAMEQNGVTQVEKEAAAETGQGNPSQAG